MLVFSSDQRVSAGKALLHPYFSEYGFTPHAPSPTSDFASETSSSASVMSEASGGSSEQNTSLSPVNASTSFSSHETSGDSLADMSGIAEPAPAPATTVS